jgi:hypothetical protein
MTVNLDSLPWAFRPHGMRGASVDRPLMWRLPGMPGFAPRGGYFFSI